MAGSVSLLCPTRNRPEMFGAMLESAHRTADGRYDLLAYVDNDDPSRDEYKRLFPGTKILIGPSTITPVIYNLLASKAKGSLLMLMGDDCVFQTKGWDTKMLEAAEQWPDRIGIVSTHDGREDNSHGHFAFGRGWYEALGYLLPPVFRHWATNMFSIDVAARLHRLVWLGDVVLKHNKVGEIGRADDTYHRLRTQGVRIWDNQVLQMCRHFAELDENRLRERMKD